MLGHKIKCARIEAGMTQAEVAKALFIAQPVVSDWENGIYSPRAPMLFAICSLLNKDLDYFKT